MKKPRNRNKPNPPAMQAGASPLNGVVPPEHSRFKPGQSGNPAGRAKNAGLFVQEYINAMAGLSREDLISVRDSARSTVAQVAAARVWLDATSSDRNAAGSPIAGAEFDRILDRTIGKPSQSVDVTSEGQGIVFQFVTAQPNVRDDTDQRSA